MTKEQKLQLFAFVKNAHGNQKYGTEPYTLHLFQVAQIMENDAHISDALMIAAYCHDLMEDTNIKEQDIIDSLIKIGFSNEDIHDAIRLVGYVTIIPKHVSIKTHELSKMLYRRALMHDKHVAIVKLCDRIANLTNSIGSMSLGHLKKYLREDEEYFSEAIQNNIYAHDSVALESLFAKYDNLIAFAKDVLGWMDKELGNRQ